MGRAQRVQHVFIVRIWQEPAAVGESSPWRGSIEHIPEAARSYFSQLPDLQQFIVRWLDGAALPADDATPLGKEG